MPIILLEREGTVADVFWAPQFGLCSSKESLSGGIGGGCSEKAFEVLAFYNGTRLGPQRASVLAGRYCGNLFLVAAEFRMIFHQARQLHKL